MFPQTHTGDHQGIPVFWADLPATTTGTLTFGVGTRDEPVQLAGITHLVEHLIFRKCEPILLMHDGVTDEDTVSFYASGTAEEVAGYLNAIAAAIRDFSTITDAQISLEKSVIAAEIERNYVHPNAGLLTYRFGANEVGMANFGSPATTSLTREEIIAWAGRWLTADNAALTMTTPIPDALDVVLPRGSVIHQPGAVSLVEPPMLVESEKEGIAVSLLVDTDLAPFLGDALFFEFHHRLRHTNGLVYSATVFRTHVAANRSQLDLVLDPTDRTFAATLKATLDAIREIGRTGFSDQAVAYARNQCEAQFGWHHSLIGGYLDQLAVDHLRGRTSPTPQGVLEQANSLTEDLNSAIQEALPTLLIAYSGEAEVDEGFTEKLGLPIDRYSAWQETTGEKHRRRARKGVVWKSKRGGDVAGTISIVRDDHVLMQSSGETVRMEFADITLIGKRECECLEIIDFRGRTTCIDPDDWHRGEQLVEHILAKVPVNSIRAFPSH